MQSLDDCFPKSPKSLKLALSRDPTPNKMAKYTPTISSGIAGSLGVLHLPRLWQKASLAAVGKLHKDYAAVGRGFDQMVLDGLGVDREAFLEFIGEKRPTYPELEAWIIAERGEPVGDDVKQAVNAAIAGHEHEESIRKEILGDAGIDDRGVVLDAISLNNLDDLAAFYREEIA